MKKTEKTNVMRLLEQKKIDYKSYDYTDTGVISGAEVAEALGQDPNQVYKTLVTQGATKNYYVFMVPVLKELNLKAGAKAVGEKSIAMIKSKELLPLTGYIHGGCSPIGMKKQFKTVIDSSVSQFETIFFSAGKIGYQVQVAVKDMEKIIRYELGEISE